MSQSATVASQWKLNALRCVVVAATSLVLGSAGSRLEATTVLPMDVTELSDQADFVFTGTTLQTEVLLSKDGSFPFTFVTFAVDDVLKGKTKERQITLRFDGGMLGDRGVEVDGMPRFEQGESYLLFVRGNGSAGCPVLGWWQGQFRYGREPGSNKRILLDSAGAAVEGITQGRFTRGPAEVSQRATKAGGGMTVLSEEGVHIVLPDQALRATSTAKAPMVETPDAAQIVDQLRSFIAGRGMAKNFRQGRLVESARTEDVPAHAAWSAARPR
ncbi:MAG TPA: hypothetical protein VKK31_03390 [Thermoanaerobaculia bacterium]|nr:hypothetical protein [Thermoanaerobaculia bacterium]